jgi:hypothetical protein
MTQKIRRPVVFMATAAVVFIGFHVFLFSTVSSGPHLDLSLGWLDMHRYGSSWTVEHVHFVGLLSLILVSVLLAWILLKSVRR